MLRNGGENAFNSLTQPYQHPERGSSWNPHGFTVSRELDLHVVPKSKLDDLITRTIDPEAIPCIIPIVGTWDLNSLMWMDLKKRLQDEDIRFLIDEMEYQTALEDTKRYYQMTVEERTVEKLSYVQTLMLITEAINLSQEWKEGKVKLTEPRSGTKDRIVALNYGNYIATLLENKMKRNEATQDFDISDWQLVF